MPFYSYRCPTCDERFEARRSFETYDDPMSCPQGHEGAVRIITSWGTGGGIRSGTPSKTAAPSGTIASLESDAKKIAQHKRHTR